MNGRRGVKRWKAKYSAGFDFDSSLNSDPDLISNLDIQQSEFYYTLTNLR